MDMDDYLVPELVDQLQDRDYDIGHEENFKGRNEEIREEVLEDLAGLTLFRLD